MSVNAQELYGAVFKDYPDILDVKQVSQILGISTKTVYRLLRTKNLSSIKVGREFRIPKVKVMKYMNMFEPSSSSQATA